MNRTPNDLEVKVVGLDTTNSARDLDFRVSKSGLVESRTAVKSEV